MPTYDLITPRSIGALISAERIRQGLAQSELAGVADVGLRFLVELERGKPTAELGKAIQVLSALGLRPVFDVAEETMKAAHEIMAEPEAGGRRRHRVRKSPVEAFRPPRGGRVPSGPKS